jgi:hypothetical protein
MTRGEDIGDIHVINGSMSPSEKHIVMTSTKADDVKGTCIARDGPAVN